MTLPPADLPYLRDRLQELGARVREAWEAGDRTGEKDAVLLTDALLQLIDMLGQVEGKPEADEANPAEIDTLGEYGLNLLDELAQLASALGQSPLATEIEALSLPFALWVVRHGGEIRHLSPVVNALAHYANQASRPAAMSSLYAQCCELLDAVSPAIEESMSGDPKHPWRLLILNRAIVATRSHNPELMESAYDAVVEFLPQDAQRFFAEGLEQMSVVGYPDHVRDIVHQYYLAHAMPRRLH